MPSTFPGLQHRALWPLEMLFAAFWDSEGDVGSQAESQPLKVRLMCVALVGAGELPEGAVG